MSPLDFTTVRPLAEGVLARSPMERRARAAGASFEVRDGWNVAVSYPGERTRLASVGFADRCALTKLELQGPPEALAQIAVAAGAGAVVEPRMATWSAGAWWCPVAPSRMLLLAEPGSSVAGAVAGTDAVTVVDVTCGLAALALIGPASGELLARFCAVDVRSSVTPVRGFRPGSIARTPGYLLREREDQLLLLVGWALGEYLWEVVADAAETLSGGPVGADVLAERTEPAHA